MTAPVHEPLQEPVHEPLPSIGGLPGIGLDELVERAALLTRVDRKYLMPVADVDPLLAGLAAAEPVRVLDVAGRRSFGYASEYLDTADLAGYHLAARGRRRRFKVRRRSYLDSGESYLEVKTSGVRGATVKERMPLDGSRCPEAFVDDALDRAGLGGVRYAGLLPVLRTGYRRTTLLLPATGARLTVDTGLSWGLPGGPDVPVPSVAVVESKSAGAASAADRRLWRAGCRPVRVSKYCTGLAALRGDLPDNRWHPVLRRHLAPLTGADPTTTPERPLL